MVTRRGRSRDDGSGRGRSFGRRGGPTDTAASPGEGSAEADAAREPSGIVDCARYRDGRRVAGRIGLAEAAHASASGDGFVWVGLREPTADVMENVAQTFDLPPLAVEDAVRAHQRPKIERYDDIVFVVLKPAEFVDGALQVSEIALFVGDGFVVVVRHGPSNVLTRVRRTVDSGAASVEHGPISVLYRAMDQVVDDYEMAIEKIEADVDEIEALVFGLSEESRAQPTYDLKRTVATLRRILLPLAVPLRRVVEGVVADLPEDMHHYFRDVHDHLQRATEELDAQDRMLSDVLQADLAKLGVRQNEIALRQNEDQRKMSAWAAIALLPTAVGGLYGMNFTNMPELHWTYSYPVVLGLIALGCFALYRNFRHRGWL